MRCINLHYYYYQNEKIMLSAQNKDLSNYMPTFGNCFKILDGTYLERVPSTAAVVVITADVLKFCLSLLLRFLIVKEHEFLFIS